MGRKPKHTFVPDDFGTLTKEERRYRGELATILRMRIKRKEKIVQLEEEISNIDKRMDGLIKKIKLVRYWGVIASSLHQKTKILQ